LWKNDIRVKKAMGGKNYIPAQLIFFRVLEPELLAFAA
jgi:hypothetical protein